MKKHEELVIITKTYDLILWSCNHTGRFPGQHRFVSGERIERHIHNAPPASLAPRPRLDFGVSPNCASRVRE